VHTDRDIFMEEISTTSNPTGANARLTSSHELT